MVVEGHWASKATTAPFQSDRILIRHGADYKPPKVNTDKATAEIREGRARIRGGRRFGAGASVVGITALLAGPAAARRVPAALRAPVRVRGAARRGRSRPGVMEWALLTPRLLAPLRRREQRHRHAAALHDHRAVGRARGVDPALGGDPRRLPHVRGAASSASARPTRWSRRRPSPGCVVALFFFALMLGPANPFRELSTVAARRPGPEPAAAEPLADGVPPADPLPRLRRLHGAVHVRDRRARHRPLRRGLARRHPPGDARRVGLPHRRHHPRRVVELRGARAGAASGRGTRWRTRRCCRGSPRPRSSTR